MVIATSFYNACSMEGSVLSLLYKLTHVIFTTNPLGRYHYLFQIFKLAKIQRVQVT